MMLGFSPHRSPLGSACAGQKAFPPLTGQEASSSPHALDDKEHYCPADPCLKSAVMLGTGREGLLDSLLWRKPGICMPALPGVCKLSPGGRRARLAAWGPLGVRRIGRSPIRGAPLGMVGVAQNTRPVALERWCRGASVELGTDGNSPWYCRHT